MIETFQNGKGVDSNLYNSSEIKPLSPIDIGDGLPKQTKLPILNYKWETALSLLKFDKDRQVFRLGSALVKNLKSEGCYNVRRSMTC